LEEFKGVEEKKLFRERKDYRSAMNESKFKVLRKIPGTFAKEKENCALLLLKSLGGKRGRVAFFQEELRVSGGENPFLPGEGRHPKGGGFSGTGSRLSKRQETLAPRPNA